MILPSMASSSWSKVPRNCPMPQSVADAGPGGGLLIGRLRREAQGVSLVLAAGVPAWLRGRP